MKTVELERQWRNKSIYYHAKGRAGMMKKDWSRLKITLQIMPAEELYRMFISGNAPLGIARDWRNYFQANKVNLNVIRSFQFMLTSKGRQQQREMIKRKTHQLQDSLLVSFTF